MNMQWQSSAEPPNAGILIRSNWSAHTLWCKGAFDIEHWLMCFAGSVWGQCWALCGQKEVLPGTHSILRCFFVYFFLAHLYLWLMCYKYMMLTPTFRNDTSLLFLSSYAPPPPPPSHSALWTTYLNWRSFKWEGGSCYWNLSSLSCMLRSVSYAVSALRQLPQNPESVTCTERWCLGNIFNKEREKKVMQQLSWV